MRRTNLRIRVLSLLLLSLFLYEEGKVTGKRTGTKSSNNEKLVEFRLEKPYQEILLILK